MRVPLFTFARDTNLGCDLYISSLNYTDDTIILGSMFFQEFYVGFVNDYSNPLNYYQQVQIYVGPNSVYSPYLGSTVLPDGPNPFSPDSSSTLGTWVVVGICVGGAVLLILISVFLIFCLNKKPVSSREENEGFKIDEAEKNLIDADNFE